METPIKDLSGQQIKEASSNAAGLAHFLHDHLCEFSQKCLSNVLRSEEVSEAAKSFQGPDAKYLQALKIEHDQKTNFRRLNELTIHSYHQFGPSVTTTENLDNYVGHNMIDIPGLTREADAFNNEVQMTDKAQELLARRGKEISTEDYYYPGDFQKAARSGKFDAEESKVLEWLNHRCGDIQSASPETNTSSIRLVWLKPAYLESYKKELARKNESLVTIGLDIGQ
jgi:hypothetical protein